MSLLSLTACIDDGLTSTDQVNLDTSSKILQFIEANDDYVNSAQCPALINAEELHSNLENYYLIDIRSANKFNNGHIMTSHNVHASSLIEEIQKANNTKAVIISSTGQHASYCTAILRFLGYSNVYSLNFGIASWNEYFASPWFSSLLNQKDPCFTKKATQLDSIYKLPNVEYNTELSLKSYMTERAKLFLSKEFIDDNSTNILNDISASYDKFNVIAYKTLEGYVDESVGRRIPTKKELYFHSYIIFYGPQAFYNFPHPAFTTFILKEENGRSFLQSNLYLQYLPNNRRIYIYSINGQASASICAYLNMLGYEAKTILFGAHNFQYSDIYNSPSFIELKFNQDKIHNYSYETE